MPQLCIGWAAVWAPQNNELSDWHWTWPCQQLGSKGFERIQNKWLLGPAVDTLTTGEFKASGIIFDNNRDILWRVGLDWGKEQRVFLETTYTISPKTLTGFKSFRSKNIKVECFWQHLLKWWKNSHNPTFYWQGDT